MKKILILSANPQDKDIAPLELDRELHQPFESAKSTPNSEMAKSAMPQERLCQTLSISGGTVSGQVAQAGGNVNQTQQINQGSGEKQLTVPEVVSLMIQIETLLKNSALSDNQKNKAIAHLEAAKEAAQEEEPDKEYAAKSLQKATRVLKDASETVAAGQGLWQRVEPILSQLITWLGVTSHFFGL
jgi:hypothetical protein